MMATEHIVPDWPFIYVSVPCESSSDGLPLLMRRIGPTEVECAGNHDFEAMNAVSNVELWSCPECGAAV